MSTKLNLLQSVVILGFGAAVVACSGTGARVEGKQCKKNWDPVQMNIHPAAKSEFKPATLPNGEYEMTRAALHFKGDPTVAAPDGFQVLIKEEIPARAKDLTPVPHADCFRNAAVTQAYSASVPGLTRLVIEDGKVKSSTAKNFGFRMSELGEFELNDNAVLRKTEAPQELFKDSSETFAVRWTDHDYEVRTKGRGTNGEYALTTFLHRVR